MKRNDAANEKKQEKGSGTLLNLLNKKQQKWRQTAIPFGHVLATTPTGASPGCSASLLFFNLLKSSMQKHCCFSKE